MRNGLVCLMLLCSLWPALAAAQDNGAETQEHIQRLYRDAKAAGKRGEIQKAYQLMREAFRLRKAPDAAMNLARIEMELAKWRDAAEHFAFGFRHYPADSDPGGYEQNLERLARVKREIVTVKLEVEPTAALVAAAGKPLGTAGELPGEIYLDPGTTELTATLEGYQPATQELTADKGEVLHVRLVLVAETKPVATPALQTDRALRGTATLPLSPPEAPRIRQRAYWPACVATGIAAAGLATGAAFALLASSTRSEIDEARSRLGSAGCGTGTAYTTQCAETRDRVDRYDREVVIARAGLVGAGIAAVAATLLFVSPPRWGSEIQVTAVGVGPRSVTVAGRF